MTLKYCKFHTKYYCSPASGYICGVRAIRSVTYVLHCSCNMHTFKDLPDHSSQVLGIQQGESSMLRLIRTCVSVRQYGSNTGCNACRYYTALKIRYSSATCVSGKVPSCIIQISLF